MWLLLWLIGVPSCMACVVVFGHWQDTVNMSRNVRNGVMRPFPYLTAKLLQLPMRLLFSICSVAVGGYAMCNWYGPSFFIIVFLHAITMLTHELTAELLSVLVPNFALGMLAFMGIWFV